MMMIDQPWAWGSDEGCDEVVGGVDGVVWEWCEVGLTLMLNGLVGDFC